MYNTLIQLHELLALQNGGTRVVLLDAQFDLSHPGAGREKHLQSHVPNSHHADLERDLSGPKYDPSGVFQGRHPLPQREDFAATVAAWGIHPGTQVVVLDNQGAMFAARAWWMLRWLGHGPVAVLDGGLGGWQSAGLSMTSERTSVATGCAAYAHCQPLVGSVDVQTVAAAMGRRCIIDARAPERFRGELEPLDAKAGHIPGARNRPFKTNLDEHGRFKPAFQLHAEWSALLGANPPQDVIHQCGSGATACHNLLALEIAGLGGGLLYPGSWSQWSADPSRPAAQG